VPDAECIQKQHGGPHLDGSKPQRPDRRRMHHSAFFWVAAFFILIAMVIFVMTDGFALRPPVHASEPVPAVRAS